MKCGVGELRAGRSGSHLQDSGESDDLHHVPEWAAMRISDPFLNLETTGFLGGQKTGYEI